MTYTCDRCGAPATVRRRILNESLTEHIFDATDVRSVDLCDECSAGLDEWLRWEPVKRQYAKADFSPYEDSKEATA